MQILRISYYDDTILMTTTCPHCNEQQMNSSVLICNYCFEPLHDIISLFNSLEARVLCFTEQMPRESADDYNI
jgi:hypothetical protein